jgi:hypothetical protein
VRHAQRALLWSGGIGDFLHYVCRFNGYLRHTAVRPDQVAVVVEATNPDLVSSFLERCFPEVRYLYVPGSIQWTKSNPLLNPHDELGRKQRPAYRYALHKGHVAIEDWFLPVHSLEYDFDPSPLGWLRPHTQAASMTSVVISARDKGFIWFPEKQACQRLLEELQPLRAVYAGTADERQDWMEPFVTCPNVESLLMFGASAGLFIGTDTGIATARELLGLPNIYCISEYWFSNLMLPFGYWPDLIARTSASNFAYGVDDLCRSVRSLTRR